MFFSIIDTGSIDLLKDEFNETEPPECEFTLVLRYS